MLGPRTPRPHGEAPLARRTAAVAFAFFLAAALHLAARGVTLAELQRAFPLYALGGFGVLIFGTSRLLVAGMAGRDVVGGASTSVATTAFAAVGAAGVYLAQGRGVLPAAFAASWGAAALLHAYVLVATVRRPPTRPPMRGREGARASQLAVRALEAGSVGFAVAASLLLPLAYAGRFPLAAALHLALVGFVIVTIMAVASHILPRFTGARPAAPLLVALAPAAVAGPALMTLGLAGERPLLVAGALVEGAAFALFAAIVLQLHLRTRRFRLPSVAYVAAPVAIGVGGLVSLAFVLGGTHGAQLATHGVLNVFGFVGLFVMGASADLYGPSLGAGAAPAKRHATVAGSLTLLGLVGAGAGTWTLHDALARTGMVVYSAAIAWQLVGILSTHRRAGRVLAAFRAS